jgi:PhnB protein
MPNAIPEGYNTVTPVMVFKDAGKAIDFYKKAFGAQEKFVMPGPGGKGIMHAELKIGDSTPMLGQEMPGPECNKSIETIGGSPVAFYIYVSDVDAAFRKASAAGATTKMPVSEMFWGDRAGTVADPFGYFWTLATHTRDLTPDQIAKGAEEFMAQPAAR